MADELAVWLYGMMVATISRKRRQLRLLYTEDAMRRYALGSPVLSMSLPLTSAPYTHLPVASFLDGLLPEGTPRLEIARELGLRQDDTYGLIKALGRDCAGAIVIQPLDEAPPPPEASILKARPLSEDELADLVANLRSAPLGVSGRVRLSLAGVQEKLLLTRLPDGTWVNPWMARPRLTSSSRRSPSIPSQWRTRPSACDSHGSCVCPSRA